MHSTAREAARVAREAGAPRLVLTHLSTRYDREFGPLVEQARAEYAGALDVASDGMVIEVPLPGDALGGRVRSRGPSRRRGPLSTDPRGYAKRPARTGASMTRRRPCARREYLIVGGGMTGHAAAAAIREVDPRGRDHDALRGGRPPLRPAAALEGAVARQAGGERLARRRCRGSISSPAGRARRARLRSRARCATTSGEVHRYEQAPPRDRRHRRGGCPTGGDRVVYFRTLADYRRLRAVAGPPRRRHRRRLHRLRDRGVARRDRAGGHDDLPGGGDRRARVPGRARRAVRDPLLRARRACASSPARRVAAVEPRGEATVVRTGRGEEIVADAVVAGLGIRPETALAEARRAPLLGRDRGGRAARDERARRVRRGRRRAVPERARSASGSGSSTRTRRSRWAAPPAATWRAPASAYAHLPFFYSDLFDLGYEAVGRLDPRLETVVSWKKPFREGVVYYLEGERVRGVLLWGIFGQVDAARALIAGRAPVARSALADAIPT